MDAPDTSAQRCFDNLLAATAADDYEQLVSMGDDTLRRSITPTVFHKVSQSLAPRIQRGCTPTYLGQLRQGESWVSLWRLVFAEGGDDRLVRVSASQGRVAGILVTPALC